MALEAFALIGRISMQGAQSVSQGLRQIDENLTQSQQNMTRYVGGVGKVGEALKTALKAGAVAAGAGLTLLGGAIIKTGIQFNAMKEQSQVAWTTLLGGRDAADQMIDKINAFAAATPFATENVDMMAKYMHNAGYEGNKMFEELTQISDVASAFAIPAAQAEEMARQMSQVQQAGVAYTEDLNVLADRGVPIFQALAEVTGTNVAEVKKMASEGKITSEIYGQAFDKVANKVKGASEAQSKTFSGMISSLQDNLGMLAGTITEGLFNKMKGALTAILEKLGEFNTALQSGGWGAALATIFPKETADMIIGAFKDLKDVFLWIKDNWTIIVAAITGISTALIAFKVITAITTAFQFFNAMMIAFRAGTVLATLAQWGFNAALLANPITWIAIAIGALIAIIVLIALNWDTVSAKLGEIWTRIKAQWKAGVDDLKAGLEWLKGLWKKISDKWNADTAALSALVKKVWTGIKNWVVNTAQGIADGARQKFDALKTGFSNTMNSIKSTATRIWNGIKTAITNPVAAAKTAVGKAVEWIKGKFNGMHISFPKIKMPHFSIKGSFSLKPPRVPTLGINWYAKGGFFNQPTVLSGLGEKGREAILPIQNRQYMQPFSLAVAENLAQILSGTAAAGGASLEVPVYLNGREIVRAIIADLDRALAKRAARSGGLVNRGNL